MLDSDSYSSDDEDKETNKKHRKRLFNHESAILSDVKCVFGILRKRFLNLKHPIRLQRLETIEHVFLSFAVLPNMLIDYDGRDHWEDGEEMKEIEDVKSDVEGDGTE
jgi:hypothetical protein